MNIKVLIMNSAVPDYDYSMDPPKIRQGIINLAKKQDIRGHSNYHSNILPFHGYTVIMCYKAI